MRKGVYAGVGILIGLIYYMFSIINVPLSENVRSSSADFNLINKNYSDSLSSVRGGVESTIFDNGSYQLMDNEYDSYVGGVVKYGKPNPMFYYMDPNESSDDSKEKKVEKVSIAKQDNSKDEDENEEEKDSPDKKLDDKKEKRDNSEYNQGGKEKLPASIKNTLKNETAKGFNLETGLNEDVNISLQLFDFGENAVLPIDEKYYNITSNFGERTDPFNGNKAIHTGLDIADSDVDGANVYSVTNGIVELVDNGDSGYGKHIIVNHGSYKTLYSHLSSIEVDKGDLINTGHVIGKVGNTGRSTGPHLHFEVRIGDVAVDPLLFIKRLELTK